MVMLSNVVVQFELLHNNLGVVDRWNLSAL